MGNCVEIGLPMLILFVIFSQVIFLWDWSNSLWYCICFFLTDFIICALVQYLKNFQFRQFPVVERFALIIALIIVWAYAHVLTASGAYKHRPHQTQLNCRTDMSNLISSAPWLVSSYSLDIIKKHSIVDSVFIYLCFSWLILGSRFLIHFNGEHLALMLVMLLLWWPLF